MTRMISFLGVPANGWGTRPLLAETQFLQDRFVPIAFVGSQIIEEPPALADELEQAATGMVILFVNLEVLGQIVDAIGEQRSLYLGRTGIGRMPL